MATIITTRCEKDAAETIEPFIKAGHTAINIPVYTLETIPMNEKIQETFNRITEYDWIIFLSKHAIDAFMELWQQYTSRTIPPQIRYVVFGNKSPEYAERINIHSEYISHAKTSAAFITELHSIIKPSEKSLLLHGNISMVKAQKQLFENLQCDLLEIYLNKPITEKTTNLDHVFSTNTDIYTVFTSPSAFVNFTYLYDYQDNILKSFSIGPTTTACLKKHNINPLLEASESSIETLTDEIISYLATK